MTSIGAIRDTWRQTFARGSNLTSLKEGIFLLFGDCPTADWPRALKALRETYSRNRHLFLKFIHHPESLSSLNGDPLDDDPKSPWNTQQQDEAVRLEIEQDVRRLPDEPLYHEPSVQMMITDILFMYCKLNPTKGGYRQGMHELVAPIILVLSKDAVDRTIVSPETSTDIPMLDILDLAFLEHDAFAIFSRIMEKACVYYEVRQSQPVSCDPTTPAKTDSQVNGVAMSNDRSLIVEKSKYIHQVCLRKADPELALHLKNFPFEDLVVFWDILFAIDPNLELVDLICVAMMLRIRWELLGADYTGCLQLLLKYPAPKGKTGPHTFIEDAFSLRLHLNPSRGAAIIQKYSMKPPELREAMKVKSPSQGTDLAGLSLSNHGLQIPYPLTSPSRFINSTGGMEALLQGAARGVMEKGEKLGINQAVRDAMGELKKNVQQLQEAAKPTNIEAQMLSLQAKNVRLARSIEEIVDSLTQLSKSGFADRESSIEMVELLTDRLHRVSLSLADPGAQLSETQADTIFSVDNPEELVNSVAMSADDHMHAFNPNTIAKDQIVGERVEEATAATELPVPSRQPLAESSLAWMLTGSDDTDNRSGTFTKTATGVSKNTPGRSSLRGASQERHSFLFGEVEDSGQDMTSNDVKQLSSLGPVPKLQSRSKSKLRDAGPLGLDDSA
ncbi:TBC1 domain family member 5 [Ceratocystis fimbriata CBS 114723]|uniref:TBC1 domain family member 5 n=1 Tax=Ceratocystis fimbriata CBS 114723 TaxID=1035309 RepID=A0A2C5X545_9PEZI|nr:TBC1 domain family member 5 [Ceratocystis fimbriata CBS 114723]